MLKDYFDRATNITRVRVKASPTMIFDLTNSIVSNESIVDVDFHVGTDTEFISIADVNELVQKVSNSSATKFHFDCSVSELPTEDILTGLLENNYTLTDFFAYLKYEQLVYKFNMYIITSRNKNLLHRSRFFKTKVV